MWGCSTQCGIHSPELSVRRSVCPLSSPSHPELKLWKLPWKQEEEPGLRGEAALCYVNSEHCYPKPGASWEKPEGGEEQEVAVKEEHNTKEVGTGRRFLWSCLQEVVFLSELPLLHFLHLIRKRNLWLWSQSRLLLQT